MLVRRNNRANVEQTRCFRVMPVRRRSLVPDVRSSASPMATFTDFLIAIRTLLSLCLRFCTSSPKSSINAVIIANV